MKLVFLSGGAREKALIRLLSEGLDVVAVITPFLTKKNDRFRSVIDVAIDNGIAHCPVDKVGLYDCLKGIDFEVLLSCGFSYIIEQRVLDLARVALNVHPTLLPKYRGYRSGPYIVMNGEEESGVTVHELTAELDKGGILVQEAFPVTPFDTTKSVMLKSQKLEPDVIMRAIQMISSGSYHFFEQDESEASQYDSLRTPEDSVVDDNMTLKELYNEIRACDAEDYPAFFYKDGEKVFIKLWTNRKDKQEGEI